MNIKTFENFINEDYENFSNEDSSLHKLAKDCTSFNEFKMKALKYLESISKSTFKSSGKLSSYTQRSLKEIWNELNKRDTNEN